MKLVEAQEGRRMLDRLVGWETSPVLWRVFGRGQAASAGRVQSVAVRLVVERERARMRFRSGQWHDLEGTFVARATQPFRAALVELDGKRVAEGRDFDPATGAIAATRPNDVVLLDGDARRRARRPAARRRRTRSRAVESDPFTEQPARAVHHVDAAAGVGPQAALHRVAHDGRRAAPLRARATSPTCVPTARTCRSRRSARRAPRSASSTARSTCPPSRARTAAR